MATCPIQPLLEHRVYGCSIANRTSTKAKIKWPSKGQNKDQKQWTQCIIASLDSQEKHRLQSWINTAHRVNRSSTSQDR